MTSVMSTRAMNSCARIVSRYAAHGTRAIVRQQSHIVKAVASQSTRSFTASGGLKMPGLMPHSEDPEPPNSVDVSKARTATPIEETEYHARADEYLNKINERLEEVAETREDLDVEYSDGILTIAVPSVGTYVLNKQPPNKQIWLASPVSGPKRFDWSIEGESMDQKEGSGTGDWVYLRDNSSLADVLRKELLVDVSVGDLDQQLAQKSTDPVE